MHKSGLATAALASENKLRVCTTVCEHALGATCHYSFFQAFRSCLAA